MNKETYYSEAKVHARAWTEISQKTGWEDPAYLNAQLGAASKLLFDVISSAEEGIGNAKNIVNNHHTHVTYAMPIPDGYMFNQAGNCATVTPIGYDSLSAHSKKPKDGSPDDNAIDDFASQMKAKMWSAGERGRGGWEDNSQVTIHQLAEMLVAEVKKGDPVDIANFCMMIFTRTYRDSELKYEAIQAAFQNYMANPNNDFLAAGAIKVQAALGLPTNGYVSADVVVAKIEELKQKVSFAASSAFAACIPEEVKATANLAAVSAIAEKVKGVKEQINQLDGEGPVPADSAWQPEDSAPKRVPRATEYDIWMGIYFAQERAVLKATEGHERTWKYWPGTASLAQRIHCAFVEFVRNNNLEGQLWFEVESNRSLITENMAKAINTHLTSHCPDQKWCPEDWPRWKGSFALATYCFNAIIALQDK